VPIARNAQTARQPLVEPLEGRTLLAADFGFAYQIGSGETRKLKNNDIANAVVVDRKGNTYVAGGFAGTVDFNPSSTAAFKLTSAGLTDAFVAKFAPDGTFVWASQLGGLGEDQATTLAVNSKGSVFVGGVFSGTADFMPGKGKKETISNGQLDGFVTQLDAAGKLVRFVPMGGGNQDVVTSLALDAGGNVLVTGLFAGGSDFGKKDLVSAGGHDAFVVKLSPTFGFVYTRKLGGVAEDTGAALALDAAGNVYVTGSVTASGDFNPGSKKTATLVSQGLEDVYLVKLDANGNFVYAKQFGGAAGDEGIGVAVDRFNNVLLTGAFTGSADLNPGTGSTTNLASHGASDVFVVKLNAAGALVWARQAGGANADGVHAIRVDRAGNAYVGGQFNGTADFDPGAGTFNLAGTPGAANGFLWKLSAAGNLVYARMLKTQAGGFNEVDAVALDNGGNLLLAGKFSGTVDFDPGKRTRNRSTTSGTSYDGFLEKLLA
jgi:hypothetical protein